MWVLKTNGDRATIITENEARELFATATTVGKMQRRGDNEILHMFWATWEGVETFHAMNMRGTRFAGVDVYGPVIFGRAKK